MGNQTEGEKAYFVNPSERSAYEQDLERIRFQSRMGFNAQTETFLAGLVLNDRMTFLDLGCGGGEAWPVLLQHVGKIMAVDMDGARLKAGQEIIDANGLEEKVIAIKGDLLHLGVPDKSVDGVYARLVLQHFTSESRQKAVEEIIRVLKPGGIAVLEDLVIFGTWKIFPSCKALDRLQEAFAETYKRRGTEPDMGLKLPGLIKAAGLENIKTGNYQILSLGKDPFKQAHLNILKTAGRGIVGMGIMSPEAFQADLEEFKNHLQNPEVTALSPTMVQVAGYKKI